ncbi:MAG: MOSC domain-containing protein [Acidimicrobiales bacterium]
MQETEQCDQCGFDSTGWTRQDLTHAFSYIAARAVYTMEDLDSAAVATRPDPETWSMLEYLDHVRDVVWGHRFIVDIARQQPDIDLGTPDSPEFAPEPADLDRRAVVDALVTECLAFEAQLEGLVDDDWDRTVTIGGGPVSVNGAVAHAMHDATHHMHDLGRIRVALGHGASGRGTVDQLNVSTGGVPKSAMVGAATIDAAGVVGDTQRNRRHHGRPFQALCLWSSDVIGSLAAEGHPVAAGSAGENITISGLDWSSVRPGTVLDVGLVRCEVTSYAVPCGHNNQWFADGNSQRIRHEEHPGWSRLYASVLRSGTIDVGDTVVVEPGDAV